MINQFKNLFLSFKNFPLAIQVSIIGVLISILILLTGPNWIGQYNSSRNKTNASKDTIVIINQSGTTNTEALKQTPKYTAEELENLEVFGAGVQMIEDTYGNLELVSKLSPLHTGQQNLNINFTIPTNAFWNRGGFKTAFIQRGVVLGKEHCNCFESCETVHHKELNEDRTDVRFTLTYNLERGNYHFIYGFSTKENPNKYFYKIEPVKVIVQPGEEIQVGSSSEVVVPGEEIVLPPSNQEYNIPDANR